MISMFLPKPGEAAPFGVFERRLAMRYLRAKRAEGGVALIAIISFVGVMLGAFGLIATMSVFNGFTNLFFEQVMGGQPHVTVSAVNMTPEERQHVTQRLTAIPGVVRATPSVNQFVLGRGGGEVNAVMVVGIPADELRKIALIWDTIVPLGTGALFEDPEQNQDIIIAGCGAARSFRMMYALPSDKADMPPSYRLDVEGAPEPCGILDPMARPLELISPTTNITPFSSTPRRKAYQVAGVFRVGNKELDENLAFMELGQAQRLFGRGDRVDVITVQVEDPRALPRFALLLRRPVPGWWQPVADFRQRLRDQAMSPTEQGLREMAAQYQLRSWQDEHAGYANAVRVERTMMRLILAIVLLITAMNILSGLVMLGKNKGKDIAILRTMGATQPSIMRVFLMIGATIGMLGTFAGLVLGVVFASYIEEFQQFLDWAFGVSVFDPEVYGLAYLPAQLDAGEVIFVCVWGLFMSCLAALPPAWSAARRDAVEALRNE